MAELKLNYRVVKECICTMQQISTRYPKVARPSASGEGQGLEEIEQLADLYVSLYSDLLSLSKETANYLDSMITDFQKTDTQKTGN